LLAAVDLCVELLLRATEIHGYGDLLDVLRLRKDELNVSFSVLDEVSGLCGGYAAKLLSPRPCKRLGFVSLALLLDTLGLTLIAVENPAALDRVRDRLVPRQVGNGMVVGASGEPAGEISASGYSG
jgi:hypothetical protein